ncbi:MAG: diacylglycerol kinase [Ignavibacteria bacterium]|nr:diacylglycerol kinase [Ignavibacteria bacterium]
MKSQEGNPIQRLILKFQVAFNGLIEGLLTDFSIQLQFIFAFIAIVIALIFNFTYIEWSIWLICISMVITLEYLNSSFESIIDRLDPSYHVLTKKAKDLGAAAVLISALFSLVIGIIFIFQHI